MRKIYLLVTVIVLLIFVIVFLVLKPFDNILNWEQSDNAEPNHSDTENETDILHQFEQESNFLEELENKILEGYQKATNYESNGTPLAMLEYLPKSFINAGIYTRENPGIPTEIMVTQLWYDPDNLKMLTITQSQLAVPDKDSGISYSSTMESGDNVNDVYPWAEYFYIREVIKDGVSVYIYMLVNANTGKEDCFKILDSLQITSNNTNSEVERSGEL